MVEWPCCYDPLRLSLGSYDLFFTNISPPLSLWARCLWVTEVDEPHNRPPAMLGHGSAVRESILGHGSAARKICWVTEVQHETYAGSRKCSTKKYAGSRKTTATRLGAALVAPSPRRPFGVLCSSVPQSDFHSHPPPLAEDAPSFWASPSDLRHRVVARSLALLLWPRLAQRRLRHGDTLLWGRRIQFKFGMLDLTTLRLD